MQPSFDAATDALSQHENLIRIKKLLIYVCQSIWESDPYRLEYFDMRGLVYQLLQLAPYRAQLRSRLDTFVRTLSKPDEYAQVADIIYNYLEPLCVEEPRPEDGGDRRLYYSIAQQLRQDPEQVRIKKILYCVQTRTWENNPALLSQIELEPLLQKLRALIPTSEALTSTLNTIVQTLNRQDYYLPIVQRIQVALAPLYLEESVEAVIDQTCVTIPNTGATAMLPPMDPATTVIPPPASRSPRFSPPPPPPRRPAAPPTPSAATPAPAKAYSAPKVLDVANLMDVRLQVMKYSNPLRAKVLLFSTLFRPLGEEHRSWEVLKTHELDSLILEAFRAFKSETELRIKLQQMAERMPESEHYTQAAGAIMRALKPYYAAAPAAQPASSSGRDDDTDTGIYLGQDWTIPNPASPNQYGHSPQ